MNKQGKGKIGWTDWTYNPIKGLCPVGCNYCYARAMYKNPRYGWDSSICLDEDELVRPMAKVKPIKIFVCSTFEIFHPAADEYRDVIFDVIKACPQHTFQVLTKMPENIDRPMPDNVWLGVSITGNKTDDFLRAGFIGNGRRKAKIQFVSYEPLLDIPLRNIPNVDWVIIGRLTGHGKKHDPPRWMIEGLVKDERKRGTPVFLKHNLKNIWPGPLIQEWPEDKNKEHQ